MFKLSRFFDSNNEKVNIATESIYDKQINNTVDNWIQSVRNQFDEFQTALDNHQTFSLVADIDARDALVNKIALGSMVWVEDATSDTTVNSGGAAYILRKVGEEFKWEKLTENESMDIVFQFSNLSDSPTLIHDADDAVSKRHTHSNKAITDGISLDAKGLKYNNCVLSGETGLDIRKDFATVGTFSDSIIIVKEVVLPDIDNPTLHEYNYTPLRPNEQKI